MRLSVFSGVILLGACAPVPDAAVDPAQPGEYRCVAATGAMNSPRCDANGGTCGCAASGEIYTFIPACGDGVAPSARWHDATDPARARAARDRSFVGDRDTTGPYCLPAPPR